MIQKNCISVLLLVPILCATVMCRDIFGKQVEPGAYKNQDVVTLNNITIDKVKKEVRIKAKIAIIDGILEYLLVGDQGKTYESVFKVSTNKPSDLNFALLLIGCEPMSNDTFSGLLTKKGGTAELMQQHRKSLLDITFYHNAEPVSADTLFKGRKDAESKFLWVYTGGFLLPDNRYSGDMDLSYIGVWHDNTAVVNLFSNQGNPYRGEDGFALNTANKALAVDQDFELVIRRNK